MNKKLFECVLAVYAGKKGKSCCPHSKADWNLKNGSKKNAHGAEKRFCNRKPNETGI